MISYTSFIIIQFSIIITYVIFTIVRNLWIKNNKLNKIIETQNKYLEEIYYSIKMSDDKIKEIDTKQIFQSDDDIGWFFTNIKNIQKTLSDYMGHISKN